MQQMPRALKITGNVTLALIAVSTLVTVVMGQLMISTSGDILVLNKYLASASALQPNLEESLVMNTTKTGKIMDQLMQFRPETEEDYVSFISAVEKVGKQLSLHVEIMSFTQASVVDSKKQVSVDDKTLAYSLSFYGTDADALRMIAELQNLPYFIAIDSVKYGNLDYLDGDDKKLPNISMVIKLYIK